MKQKTIQCSVVEYAGLRGISRQAVLQFIAANKDLIHVVSRKKIGRAWILDVDKDFYDENKHLLR